MERSPFEGGFRLHYKVLEKDPRDFSPHGELRLYKRLYTLLHPRHVQRKAGRCHAGQSRGDQVDLRVGQDSGAAHALKARVCAAPRGATTSGRGHDALAFAAVPRLLEELPKYAIDQRPSQTAECAQPDERNKLPATDENTSAHRVNEAHK